MKIHDHDFPDPVLGKIDPVRGLRRRRNAGFVNVGTDHDTRFAVDSLRRWWQREGRDATPRPPSC